MQAIHGKSLVLVVCLLAVAGCDAARQPSLPVDETPPAGTGPANDAAADERQQPAAPMAPIRIDYNVIGVAFVGQPVSIEIDISSTVRDRPIALEYRINDPRDLKFAEAQPERVAVSAIGDAPSARRQVTVIPQREGRLFLNIAAEIETQEITLIKAMAVPIQVARSPAGAAGDADETEKQPR